MRTLALLALMAAVPPQQFNLVCAGKTDVIAPGVNSQTPYNRVLRIDLTTSQWCAGECAEVEPIARVEPGRLLLRDVKRDTPRENWTERESVDRVTGYHSSIAEAGIRTRNPQSAFSSGHCEAAPFTGFARGPAKF